MIKKINLQLFGNPNPNETKEKTTEELIAEALANAKSEWEKEKDKAITAAIKTREDKIKKELELEKMSEEEKVKALLKDKEDEIAQYKRQIAESDLTSKAISFLKEAELDDSLVSVIDISKYIGAENAEAELKNKVASIKTIFDKAAETKTEQFKAEILKGNTHKSINNTDKQTVTEVDTAFKNGNALQMIMQKLTQKE